MAEINESIWGPKEKWINIDANQPSGKPDNQILKGAWFEDPNRGTIEYGLSNDKLELETDWDNSLSYAGFGYKAPLSNIDWWYVGEGEINQLQQLRSDTRTKTNFAIGSNGQAANNFYKIQGYAYSPTQRPWEDRWNCGAVFSSVSGYANFTPWTQIPIKRIVLVPLIHAWNSDFSSDGYYELGNYLDNHLQDRPYITTVSARIYYDRACEYNPETGIGTINRINIGEFNTAILEHSVYGDGYEDANGNDETGIYQPLYGNSDRGPIMGPLVDRTLPGNQTDGVWCVPVANGFGLEWNKLSHSNEDFIVDGNGNSRIYLDTNDYTEEQLREGIRQAIACYGMFFADGENEARPLPLDDNKMMLGILEDGFGNGKYSHGKDNKNQDQWNWDDLHENDYDPNQPDPEPPGPEPDPNPIGPETPGFTLAVDNGSVNYVITKAEWNQIWNDIYGGSKSNWKNLIEGLALYGANPLNCILNYRWYPFTITAGDTSPLRLGSSVVQPSSHVYHKISYQTESFKSTTATFWAGRAKNFVESKKTKCRIFLPFYGYYELPMSLVMKKELEIQFQYDLPNDTGIWFIMFGGTIYDWVECSPYIEIPITGDNSLQIAAAKAQRNLQIAGTVAAAVITAGAGIAMAAPGISNLAIAAKETASITGGSVLGGLAANISGGIADGWLTAATSSGLIAAGGAIGAGAAKTASSVYNTALQVGTLSTNVPIHSVASDTTFLSLPMYPYIQFYQNDMQQTYDATGYKKSTGIACNCWKKISEMDQNSLLAVSTPVLDDYSNMEATEIEALHAALVAGFYA